MASPWCCSCGLMGTFGSLWACACGTAGASKYVLALELLSYARNRLHCRPEYVLFDAWYPSKALLKRIRDYGWYFVCRLKKNRRFNDQPLRDTGAIPIGRRPVN